MHEGVKIAEIRFLQLGYDHYTDSSLRDIVHYDTVMALGDMIEAIIIRF